MSDCPRCDGTGHLLTTRVGVFGEYIAVKHCPHCDGTGKVERGDDERAEAREIGGES